MVLFWEFGPVSSLCERLTNTQLAHRVDLPGDQAPGRGSHHLREKPRGEAAAGLIINGTYRVDLPREKKVEIGLTYIFGMGRATAQRIKHLEMKPSQVA